MGVIGAVLSLAVGAGLGYVILWCLRAPVRAAGYVSREVRARDARNRATLAGTPGEFSEADHERALRAGRAAMAKLSPPAPFGPEDEALLRMPLPGKERHQE